jgi:hypothetical protein
VGTNEESTQSHTQFLRFKCQTIETKATNTLLDQPLQLSSSSSSSSSPSSSSSSSFKFSLGFPHNRSPLCSIQSFCSSSFSSIHLHLGLPFLLPPPVLPSSNFFTVLLPSTLTTCRSHSNLHTVITVTISGGFKLIINFLVHFYFPGTIFICWLIYFSQDFPFPCHSGSCILSYQL